MCAFRDAKPREMCAFRGAETRDMCALRGAETRDMCTFRALLSEYRAFCAVLPALLLTFFLTCHICRVLCENVPKKLCLHGKTFPGN